VGWDPGSQSGAGETPEPDPGLPGPFFLASPRAGSGTPARRRRRWPQRRRWRPARAQLTAATGPPGRAPWSFTRDHDPGPPGGLGSWTLTLPRPGWHQWTTPTGRTYTQGPKHYPA
jgi:hypothetical protein